MLILSAVHPAVYANLLATNVGSVVQSVDWAVWSCDCKKAYLWNNKNELKLPLARATESRVQNQTAKHQTNRRVALNVAEGDQKSLPIATEGGPEVEAGAGAEAEVEAEVDCCGLWLWHGHGHGHDLGLVVPHVDKPFGSTRSLYVKTHSESVGHAGCWLEQVFPWSSDIFRLWHTLKCSQYTNLCGPKCPQMFAWMMHLICCFLLRQNKNCCLIWELSLVLAINRPYTQSDWAPARTTLGFSIRCRN